MAALLGCSYIVLPIALLSSWIGTAFFNAKRSGDMKLIWIGFALALVGVLLLCLARLPLYRQGCFLTFGRKDLDEPHRRLYLWAYRLIIPSVCLLVSLLIWLAI